MKLARNTLLATALMFLFFGVAILLFPVEILKLCEIELVHPTAKMEIRAFYGGLEIGLAVYLLLCRSRGALTDGLRLCLLLLGGILLGRITGAAVDGVQGNYLWYTLPVEGTLFALSYISLGQLRDLQQHL